MTSQENPTPKPLSDSQLSRRLSQMLGTNYQAELREEQGTTGKMTKKSELLYGPLTAEQTASYKTRNDEGTLALAQAQGNPLAEQFLVPGRDQGSRQSDPLLEEKVELVKENGRSQAQIVTTERDPETAAKIKAANEKAFGYLRKPEPDRFHPFALTAEQTKRATAEWEALRLKEEEENETVAAVSNETAPKNEGWTSIDDRARETIQTVREVASNFGEAVENFSKNPPVIEENSIPPLNPEWVNDGRELDGPEKSVADYLGDFLDVAPPYRFQTFVKFIRGILGGRKDESPVAAKSPRSQSKLESEVASAAD